jgi:hypothetical protein
MLRHVGKARWITIPLGALALTGCGSGHANPASAGASQGSKAAGANISQSLQAGWNSFEFPSEPIIAEDLTSAIKGKPLLTQVGAIETTYLYLEQKEQNVTGGSPQGFLQTLETTYPATAATVRADVPTLTASATTSPTTPATSPAQGRTCWEDAIASYAASSIASMPAGTQIKTYLTLLSTDAVAYGEGNLPASATSPAITSFLKSTQAKCGRLS